MIVNIISSYKYKCKKYTISFEEILYTMINYFVWMNIIG